MKPAISPILSVSRVPVVIAANRLRPGDRCRTAAPRTWLEHAGRQRPGVVGVDQPADDGEADEADEEQEADQQATCCGGTEELRPTASASSRRAGWSVRTVSSRARASMSASPIDDARVEQRVDEVEDQRGQADGDDQDEDDPLDDEEIGALDRLEQHRADAGIAEDDLHQDGAGDQLAEDEANAVACGSMALRTP